MMSFSLDSLAISHVSQEKISEHRLDINFTANHTEHLYMVLYENDGFFTASSVLHTGEKHDVCPFCKNKKSEGYWNHRSVCDTLFEQKEELFKRLIVMPSIRLEWLFLHYSEGEETK